VNWDAISAIGEVVGTTAVILTLIFMALQIRRSTLESKMTAARELAIELHNAMAACSADPVTTEVYLVGVRDPSNLNYRDRYKFNMLCYRLFLGFEQQYLNSHENTIYKKYFESSQIAFMVFLEYPGIRAWWNTGKNMFPQEYRKYVSSMIDSIPERKLDEFAPEYVDTTV
jgi:hypothetical protein